MTESDWVLMALLMTIIGIPAIGVALMVFVAEREIREFKEKLRRNDDE